MQATETSRAKNGAVVRLQDLAVVLREGDAEAIHGPDESASAARST